MSRGKGSGEGEQPTLLQNNTLSVHGHTKSDTRPGGRTRQKPKDLSTCESEEGGHVETLEGGGVYATPSKGIHICHTGRRLFIQ
jgi:hypothetical protein